jgi:hypothetical protein
MMELILTEDFETASSAVAYGEVSTACKCFHTWRVRLVDGRWRVAAQMVERFAELNESSERLFATQEEGLNK